MKKGDSVDDVVSKVGASSALDLSDNMLGGWDKLPRLFDALLANSTLKHLDLSSNEIGDLGAGHMARACNQNSSLTALHLFDNKIGPAGVVALASALQKNTKCAVQSLDLGGNAVGAAGSEELAFLIRSDRLTWLGLGNTDVGDKGVRRLLKQIMLRTTHV